jgi:hypothetical protein
MTSHRPGPHPRSSSRPLRRTGVRACHDPGHCPDCGSFTGTAQAPLRIEGSPPQGLLPWHESDVHWATENAQSNDRVRLNVLRCSSAQVPWITHVNRTLGAGRTRPKRRIEPSLYVQPAFMEDDTHLHPARPRVGNVFGNGLSELCAIEKQGKSCGSAYMVSGRAGMCLGPGPAACSVP